MWLYSIAIHQEPKGSRVIFVFCATDVTLNAKITLWTHGSPYCPICGSWIVCVSSYIALLSHRSVRKKHAKFQAVNLRPTHQNSSTLASVKMTRIITAIAMKYKTARYMFIINYQSATCILNMPRTNARITWVLYSECDAYVYKMTSVARHAREIAGVVRVSTKPRGRPPLIPASVVFVELWPRFSRKVTRFVGF